MTVCIIDTSIFCEILSVPNMHSDQARIKEELKAKLGRKEELMLPLTTILETGNHIGQNGDGNSRRKAAERFVQQVTLAIEGKSPFTATAFPDHIKLASWLDEFPNWATRVDGKGKGSGLGDLTIFKEWCDLCEKFPKRRVYVWSKDAQLSAYDRAP